MIEENSIKEQKHPQKATERFNVEGQPDDINHNLILWLNYLERLKNYTLNTTGWSQ